MTSHLAEPITDGVGTADGWTADASTFGARLALIRQRKRWGNVKEAAESCGIPVETWRRWERDGRRPLNFMSACQAISKATGADLAWLAGLATQATGSQS